ncbi:MAG TPA: hypothetical protein VD865_00465 [Stenotrophomonas sp.]|nr:hypothetical protein [Stenotrophomonas sp.]
MHIECTHHIDASEPDEDGMHEYYYEYDMYRFTDGALCLVARSYSDEPDEAHFLCFEVDGHRRTMTDRDLTNPLLLAAQAHLRAAGKIRLQWLSGRGTGYEPLPPCDG